MGKYQHKLLTVGIDHTKRKLIVPAGTEIRICPDIVQIIIHKSHIPFQVKSQAILFQAARDLRPGSRFLRDHEHSLIALLHDGVQMFQELYSFQILIAAVQIGHPLSILLAVIQIQHGSHRIDTDTICMVLFYPIQRIGDQIVTHFRPAVIIDQRPPMRMETLSRILMLIQACPVKV